MRYVQIKSLPKIILAHSYGTDSYRNFIPVSKERGMMELCYASKGEIPVWYGEEYVLQKQYYITCNLYDRETRVVANDFHEHRTIKAILDYEVCEKERGDFLNLPVCLPLSVYGKAHGLLDEIIRIYTINPNETLTLSGLFLQLLSEYDKESRSISLNLPQTTSIYVEKAKEYVYTHLNTPILLKDVADYLHITSEYLCYLFKKHTNMTFIHFVNHVKLSKIRDLMERENLKLYEAAELYGFNDPNYVSKLYKKYYGNTIKNKIFP